MAKCTECGGYLTIDGIGHVPGCAKSGRPRSTRKRQTPEEVEAMRREQRIQEAPRREREMEVRKQITERAREALLATPPSTSARRSSLDDVACNIHNAYDWQGRSDQCVTAVIKKRNGRQVVFSQRYMSVMEEYAGRHHAQRGLTFKHGGGSICMPGCTPFSTIF